MSNMTTTIVTFPARAFLWLKRKFDLDSNSVVALPLPKNRDTWATSRTATGGNRVMSSHELEVNSILPVPTVSEQCNDPDTGERVEALECGGNPEDQTIFFVNTSVGNVQTHFKIMYMLCTSAYQGTEKVRNDPKNGIYFAKMILFWLTIILSIFQSFCDAKYAFLWFLFGGGVRRFVRVVFSVVSMATTLFAAQTLFWKRNLLREMICILRSFELRWKTGKAYSTLPITLTVITISVAFLRSFLLREIKDLSIKNIILYSSFPMSEDLFLWSSHDLNITSKHLDIQYGSTLNTQSILLAIAKIIRDFIYRLQSGMMNDLILILVVTLYSCVKGFTTLVEKCMKNITPENLENGQNLQRDREMGWGMYRELKSVFNAVNNVLGPLLVLFHVTNLLRYAVFMERCIYLADSAAIVYIQLLYDIVRSEVIYIVAARIADQNMSIRNWLRNWSLGTGKIQVNNVEMDTFVVFDELNHEPIGLGQGNFAIHQGFHFGLLGRVGTLFVMMSNKTAKLGKQFPQH